MIWFESMNDDDVIRVFHLSLLFITMHTQGGNYTKGHQYYSFKVTFFYAKT